MNYTTHRFLCADVEDHMYIAKEESFGPIMIISSFRDGDVDGVLRRANATEFGLGRLDFDTSVVIGVIDFITYMD